MLLEDLDDLCCHFVHIALHTNPRRCKAAIGYRFPCLFLGHDRIRNKLGRHITLKASQVQPRSPTGCEGDGPLRRRTRSISRSPRVAVSMPCALVPPIPRIDEIRTSPGLVRNHEKVFNGSSLGLGKCFRALFSHEEKWSWRRIGPRYNGGLTPRRKAAWFDQRKACCVNQLAGSHDRSGFEHDY